MKKTGKVSSLMLLVLLISACQTNGNSSKISSSSASSNIIQSTSTSTNKNESITTSSSDINVSSPSSSTSSGSSTSTSTNSNISTNPPVTNNKLYDATLESNAPSYYESVRGLKGIDLKNALHELIDGHEEFSYNSSINDYMKEYDVDINNPNNIMLVYTGSASKNTSFNKEHVWAKSHGDFGTAKGAGSDLHNLRPSYEQINSSRGNKDFAEGGTEYENYPGNYSTSSTFEPRDDFKGDVARTIFYMATRYDDSSLDLEVESPTDTSRYLDLSSGASGVHGDFDDLYSWATSGIDPVDDYEVNRNNIIYEDYQHNRNPFVDHPEFIIMIYDKTYNGAGALNDTSTGLASPQESALAVINMINEIGTINLNSLSKIEAAETAYQSLSAEAKELVSNYTVLVEARTSYNKLYEETIVEHVVSLIDSIETVTIDDKAVIEEAETAYAKLTQVQKDQVTNYNVLTSAREQLDEILAQIEQTNKVIYEGVFMDSSGVSGAYGDYDFTMNGKSWTIKKGYKSGEFRVGHNKTNTLDSKFYTPLGLDSNTDGSSLVMNFDVNNAKGITFEFGTCYGTPSKVYILKSTDGGTTFVKCHEIDYIKGSTTEITYEGDIDSSVRYALVITGSTPRIVLTSVSIKGIA